METATDFKTILNMRSEADAHYALGNPDKAVALYWGLAETNPYDGELWKRIGECERQLGNQPAVIHAYEQALRLGCKFPWMVLYELARLHAGLGQKTASLDCLEKSLSGRLGGRSSLMDEEIFKSYHDDPRFRQLAGTPPLELDRDEGWRFDLDFLMKEAQRLHVGLNRPAYSDAFLASAADLHRNIPSLSNEQIFLAMHKLVVQLGDGHSRLFLDGSDKINFRMLPLDLWLFQDGLFIVNGLGEAAQWIGWQVLRFGSLGIDEIMDKLSDYLPADNVMQIKWLGMTTLILPAYLHALGASESDHSVLLTLRNQQGEIREVVFAGADLRRRPRLVPSALSDDPPPLYLRDTQTNIWSQALPESEAVFVQYNEVMDSENQTIVAFAARLKDMLSTLGPKNVIVDVRHNSGGNNFLNWPLVQTLIHYEMSHPENRLFVITGRGTFSAAQNFINWIERSTRAIFVGEPSSSRPNFVGETTPVILPYSRIEGSISSRMHIDSFWGDERMWIAPHLPVELSSGDYFANQDPAMTAVLAVIDSS